VASARPLKITLVRHGKPAIATAPRTSHREFRTYIDDYEDAGLDPTSAPPEELQDLIGELDVVFTSGRKRAEQSARALAPNAELIVDPLFVESPLASPRIPLLKMRVAKWAVVSRLMWYAGFSPKIEGYRKSKRRAAKAAEILIDRARKDGQTALVAHGYFNYLIGIELRHRGFRQTGSHRARYWNDVTYERSE
jgi:broad specificity phosphatase PhoE